MDSIPNMPLAERLRPTSLDDYFGQKHLIGKDAIMRQMIESGNITSFILWGPPGVGKTTLAKIIAKQLDRPFFTLSAVSSGVKDVRESIEKAKKLQFFNKPNPILFIDEIHRFSKSQQDSLLGAVEQGIVTLIGATTENPSFEVISPLLSRCQVYILKSLENEDLLKLLNKAINDDFYLKNKNIVIKEDEAILRLAGGDARKLLNIIELLAASESSGKIVITDDKVLNTVQQNISAFIKSIRGSDPNAAVYWLARMVEGGEDLKFIARRLVILASEDIGLANPNALLLATSCFQAVSMIGWPESRIILSEATIYLATSPKSNSAYMAIKDAQKMVQKTGNLSVPLQIRNAPTKLMKDEGYGKDYKYAHEFKDSFTEMEFLPDEISGSRFYKPKDNSKETEIANKLHKMWKDKYKY